MDTPYRSLLGTALDEMPPGVRQAHRVPLRARGIFEVHRGGGKLGRAIANRMALPRAGQDVRVELDVQPEGARVRWRRRIGDDAFETLQWASRDLLMEKMGRLRLGFRLQAQGGTLFYRQVAFWVGGVRIPWPFWPRVEALVGDAPGGWHVQVEVRVPILGSLCRYGGRMAAL